MRDPLEEIEIDPLVESVAYAARADALLKQIDYLERTQVDLIDSAKKFSMGEALKKD